MHEFNPHNSMMMVSSPKQHFHSRFLGGDEQPVPRNQLIHDERNNLDDASSYRPKYE